MEGLAKLMSSINNRVRPIKTESSVVLQHPAFFSCQKRRTGVPRFQGAPVRLSVNGQRSVRRLERIKNDELIDRGAAIVGTIGVSTEVAVQTTRHQIAVHVSHVPSHGDDISNWNAKSDFSGSYNDLTNKPTIPSKTSDLTNDSGYITGVAWNDVTGKPTFATVATSGDYTDLINTPTIPAAPVQTDWSEYDSSSLAYLANRPSWVRNTQQWTLQDDQQVSKGIPMVITNNYQWGLGVNEIIAPAYGRTATTDLLTVKTTDANGEVITDTIMHVGTNG